VINARHNNHIHAEPPTCLKRIESGHRRPGDVERYRDSITNKQSGQISRNTFPSRTLAQPTGMVSMRFLSSNVSRHAKHLHSLFTSA
jgi:hypothetical protein